MAKNDQAAAAIKRVEGNGIEHAVRLIRQVCRLSRSINLIAETRAALRAEDITAAVRHRDLAALFDWLITMLSYRGIADRIAADYLDRYGQATWLVIDRDLHRQSSCPKLRSYWHFVTTHPLRRSDSAMRH